MNKHITKVLCIGYVVLAFIGINPAVAEEEKAVGGLVRHVIMMPLVSRSNNMIVKTMPVIIEIHATTNSAKDFLTDRMATLQDAYMQATYGKVYSDIDYESLSHILEETVRSVAGDDLDGQYNITIQVNVKPK